MASKFWVGGTGTWDSTTTTHWATSSNGAGGTAAPVAGDTITFDGSSGGGVVTVDPSIVGIAFGNLTAGAFTGTLDFSNALLTSLTFGQLNLTGTGARKFLMGTCTYNLTGTNLNNFDLSVATNLDALSDFSSATFVIKNAGTNVDQTFAGGTSHTYGTLTIEANINRVFHLNFTTAITFANININPGCFVSLPSLAGTITISNAVTWNCSAASPSFLGSDNRSQATISFAAGSVASWMAFESIIFSGVAPTITNSFNLGNCSGATIGTISSGGGSGVIGG